MIFSRHARQRFHERIAKVEPGYDFEDFVSITPKNQERKLENKHQVESHQFAWPKKNTRSCIGGMRSV